MGIPIKGLYTDQPRLTGEVSESYPANYTRTNFASGDIPFGVAMMLGLAGESVSVYNDATKKFAGVAVRSPEGRLTDSENILIGYKLEDVVGCFYQGIIAVVCEEAVDPTDVVRIRHTNHATDPTQVAGQFCTTAEAGKTAVLKGAEFRNVITAAGVVSLYLSGYFEVVADI